MGKSRKQKAESRTQLRHLTHAVIGFLFSAFSFQFSAFGQLTNDIPPLAPAYPEIPPTLWEQHGGIIILAAAFILVVLALLAWWMTRPQPIAPVPPEIEARRALELLRQRNEDGDTLSEVSQILRRYFAATFELPGNAATTSEFCAAVSRNEKMGARLANDVAEFLRRCDEIKFATNAASTPLNATNRALELIELAETRRAELRCAETQAKTSSVAST